VVEIKRKGRVVLRQPIDVLIGQELAAAQHNRRRDQEYLSHAGSCLDQTNQIDPDAAVAKSNSKILRLVATR